MEHLPISRISQLLLTQLWPNFKGSLLGSSLTDANPLSDICPRKMCPGDICPYQQYLSCYWLNFDETLKVGSWENLEQIPRWNLTKQHLSWQYLSKYWIFQLLEYLSCYCPNHYGALIFVDQQFLVATLWPAHFCKYDTFFSNSSIWCQEIRSKGWGTRDNFGIVPMPFYAVKRKVGLPCE